MTKLGNTYWVGKVTITVHPYGGDLGSFLDMLRYDRCLVEAWSPTTSTERSTTVTVTLRSERPFTIGRWHSFGLILRDLNDEVIA